MNYRALKILLIPLLKGGHEWQYVDLNGKRDNKPKLFFSIPQYIILIISIGILFKLNNGLTSELMGFIISAFSISVSLFMSLLISIFDKFEKTNFDTKNKIEIEIERLKQKKFFFQRFISVTSYLVVLSVLIIVLCSMTYIFKISCRQLSTDDLCFEMQKIDFWLTIKGGLIFIYRAALNYFLLNYLLLTLFIAGSSYEYYISELNNVNIK